MNIVYETLQNAPRGAHCIECGAKYEYTLADGLPKCETCHVVVVPDDVRRHVHDRFISKYWEN